MWTSFFTYYVMSYVLLQVSWNTHLEFALAKAAFKLVYQLRILDGIFANVIAHNVNIKQYA